MKMVSLKHWWSVQGAGKEGVSDAWINNLMRANCQNHVGLRSDYRLRRVQSHIDAFLQFH